MPPHYSQNKDILPLTGGCPCGLIRYQISLPPLLVHCCYCTACQRQTGSVLALNAIVESTAVTLLPSTNSAVPGSISQPEPVATAASPAFASITSAEALPQAPKLSAGTAAICLPSQSGLGQTVVGCPDCRTGLWNHYADAGPHLSYVRVGTLDRPWEIEPDVHIYTSSRRSFLNVDDGKPSFEKYYPKREELLREDALDRHKALGPKIGEYWASMKGSLGSK
ncbi:hypothetical protein FZEAL_3325 [Fusarium zealandicum]|uniref:CENP-V/GFA domain-containing protein n=1 Tax=Fusarium zealandicum TaxID=1053134 RepID=A0A8H4XLX5_9HYPO|nr:hypothetical protein FZEAL_3325 [Fusarium zealandicum]